MRNGWKTLRLLAAFTGAFVLTQAAAKAQFPPAPGGNGMPPGPGMMLPGMFPRGPAPGMPTGMGPGAFGGYAGHEGTPADFPNPAVPPQEPVSPFSMKDDGSPNAFTNGHDPYAPWRAQFSIDYMMMWFRAAHLPVLATTGQVTDPIPGALGQPGTVIIASDGRAPGLTSGFRTNLMIWVVDPELLAIEGNYFLMEQRSLNTSFSSNDQGSPFLARPFFNVPANQEDADPRAIPGVLRGTIFDSMRTRLMGAEANLRCYSSYNAEGFGLNGIAGGRWLRLDERYMSVDATSTVGIPGTGVDTQISDTFTTYNQFFGGQLGAELTYRSGHVTFGVLGKVAVGQNFQTLKISGQTTQNDQVNIIVTDAQNQGLFAQPDNVGTYRDRRVSVLAEAGARVTFNLSDRIRFNARYTVMHLSNVIRPGDQINRNLTIQPLGVNGLLPPAQTNPFNFRTTFFDAQMVQLGLEFLF